MYNNKIMKNKHTKEQVIPLVLTVIVFIVLSVFYFWEIVVLNVIGKENIVLHIRIADVIVGTTIYLKTSIDFALFMGNLMKSNSGWKNRIAIEIGTAVGNALGTMAILAIWNFFREVEWLLAIMIFVAALVLFRLAKDGIEHAVHTDVPLSKRFKKIISQTETAIDNINKITDPVLSKIMPQVSMKTKRDLTFKQLFFFSCTVPFILGLDDFAGYVPLFNIVNVFGFGIGVFLGHMLLNALLFVSPSKTIAAVKNPIISFLGAIAFIGLGAWGLFEVGRILIETYIH